MIFSRLYIVCVCNFCIVFQSNRETDKLHVLIFTQLFFWNIELLFKQGVTKSITINGYPTNNSMYRDKVVLPNIKYQTKKYANISTL